MVSQPEHVAAEPVACKSSDPTCLADDVNDEEPQPSDEISCEPPLPVPALDCWMQEDSGAYWVSMVIIFRSCME